MDGSGFYYCGYLGKSLRFIKIGNDVSFTVCQVAAYTDEMILHNPTATTNEQY